MEKQKLISYESNFGEFPDLLFCTGENDLSYFDATQYIVGRGNAAVHSTGAFSAMFSTWIDAAGKIYGLSRDEMFTTDPTNGHELMEASLAMLFVAYIDPSFGIYMSDCITQMLLEGFMCSDTYILMQARNRFTESELFTNDNQ